jgi:FlgD Ig-like domain
MTFKKIKLNWGFLFFCLMIGSTLSFSQTTVILNADGPGNTYERIDSAFGSGASSEVPDNYPSCNLIHSRHVTEAWDSTLNKYVFLFKAYYDPPDSIDYDRCSNTDRQRIEIKTVASNVTGGEGALQIYKWKFKMDSLFQPSPNFCHLHQIKHTGGTDDGAPIMTITPRHYSDTTQPEWLQLIFTPSTGGSGGGTLDQVELAPLKGIWLEVTEQALFSDVGKYEVTIKKLDGTVVMHYVNYFLDMSRGKAGYHRGKWGIYRSLNSPSYMRDETVKFSDFEITSGVTYPAPSVPSNLSATVMSEREIDLTWNDNSDNEKDFLIQRSTDGANWTTVGAADSNGTSFVDDGLEDSTTYYYRVRAEDWNGFSVFTDSVKATTLGASKALSDSWFDKDIGYDTPAGYASIDSSGNLIIEGSGSDIYGSTDQFHFVYQNLSGDGVITARVDSVQNTSEWAKAGVMIRATLDGDSQHGMNVVTPEHGVAFQYRNDKGGSSHNISGDTVTVPYWVRLVRHGNELMSYESPDGMSWDTVGSTNISMPTSAYTGLAVTAHNSGVLCYSMFSNISITNDTTDTDYIWLEAELADSINQPMMMKKDYEASAGEYIISENEKNTSNAPADGHTVYHFNIKTEGTYWFWGRVIAATTGSNSFWFKIDDNDWVPWNDNNLVNDNWLWGRFTDNSSGDSVVKYNLAEGIHSLTLTYREPGMLLDKILVTSDSTFNPAPDTMTTSVNYVNNNIPNGYMLYNSYPNPFNPSTVISYQLPEVGNVTLIIYDIMGREVARIEDGYQAAGKYNYTWNTENVSGRNLASGTYFARLRAGNYMKVIKLLLIK